MTQKKLRQCATAVSMLSWIAANGCSLGGDVSLGDPEATGGTSDTGGTETTGGTAPTNGTETTGGAAIGTGGALLGAGGTSVGAVGGVRSGSGGQLGSSGSATGGDSNGTGGTDNGTGGAQVSTGGTATGASGGSAAGGQAATGPYAPRTGSFKMLVYSITKELEHDSIPAGQKMLQDIAKEQGFEVTIASNNSEITSAGLAKYEIVFFMNSTGDIFNETEQEAYEDWMISKYGAYGGTHSATDTESAWSFYKEVTGQYYDGHDACCGRANVEWDTTQANFIAVKGLPSPWQRNEEWYLFNKSQDWSSKAGFKILSRVTINNNTRPVSYIREWGNFRSFYTSIGHQAVAFQDANVKRHVAAGIMWAVRREALLK